MPPTIGRKDAVRGPGTLERLLASTTGRLLLLLGFAATLWLLSALVASTAGAFSSYGEALWSGVRHLLDPGSLGDDETAAQRIVGVIQVVAGIVLVVGLALTVLSEVIDRLLQRLGESDPPVRAAGHLLVIGDGDALLPVLGRLAARRPGASAVVLVKPGDAPARRELQARLAAAVSGLAVRVVGGDATTPGGLARASAATASAIAVLSSEDDDDDAADVEAIEISATLAATLAAGGRSPHVGVEMRRGRNVDSVWERFPPSFDAVVRDRALGALLTIVARNPAFAALLGASGNTDEQGLFVLATGAEAGCSFGGLLERFGEAIPVGLFTGNGIRYAPDPATRLGDADRLIVSAPSQRAARGGIPSSSQHPDDARDGSGAVLAPVGRTRGLILGWSDAASSLLGALAAMPGQRPLLTVLATAPPPAAGAVELDFWTGDPADPDELARSLQDAAPDVVLVTSPMSENDGGDARAALTALHTCRILGATEVPVLVEQRSRAGSRSLSQADRRIQVVAASALAGETIALAAVDPDALAIREALAEHRTERLRVAAEPGTTVAFAALYRELLAAGSVPIAVVRAGLLLTVGATSRLKPGDELLVVSGKRRDRQGPRD